MGAAPQQGREGAAPPPRCLISQRYSSLPSFIHREYRVKEKRRGKEIRGKRKPAEKHLLKALILFCDKILRKLEEHA